MNAEIDGTTIDIDMKLSTLKPLHAKTINKIYKYLKSDKGKDIILAGWRAAGITQALAQGRENNFVPSLNP